MSLVADILGEQFLVKDMGKPPALRFLVPFTASSRFDKESIFNAVCANRGMQPIRGML